jgi:hypothetical protein
MKQSCGGVTVSPTAEDTLEFFSQDHTASNRKPGG